MTIKLFNQQVFKEDNIIQNWYRIEVDEFLLKPQNSEKPIKTNKRAVGITLPLNYDKDKEYNYIINFDFNIDGKSSDWFQWEKNKIVGPMYTGYGGYIPLNNETKLWYTKGQQTGFNYLMSLMKNLVNNYCIIIQLSMTEKDNYYFSECHKGTKPDINKYCWSPNNPDLNYFKHLFDYIKTNKFPIKLNYSKMSFLGYSVGAQAVSRYINEFPLLKTISGLKFPKITSAVLIAGGSYFCYDSYLYNTKPFKNCIDQISLKNPDEGRGCCPDNIIEQNFHDGKFKWSEHPPVLLVQQSNDFFADPNASIFYFNIMSKNNAPVLRISDNSDTHGINSFQQSNQIFNFISNIFDLEDKHKINIINLILLIIFVILFFINIYMISKTNNKFYYIILLILIVIILFLSINLYQTYDNFKITNDILQNNRDKNKSYTSVINKEDIIKKINANGILITMNSTNLYCPEFKETLKKCPDSSCNEYITNCPLGRSDVNCKCVDASQCTLFDIGNIEELLNYNLTDAGTSCFACDTTYLNKNLPPQLFGPYLYSNNGSYNGLGESFPIGFLLDFDNLRKNGYIACGYTFDAGSIGRTPPDAVPYIYSQSTANKCINEALKITDEDLSAGKLHVGNKGKINKNNCPASVMAGCLNYDATYIPGDKVPNLNKLSSDVIQSCKDIPSEKCLTQNAFSDKSINPFFELNDKGFQNFKKHAEQIQSILGKQSRITWDENNIKNFYDTYNTDVSYPDYWAYQIPNDIYIGNKSIGWKGGDGYKETEVDLFIPQKKGTNIKIKCQPTEKFKQVWKESILGVFTNNICYQDIKYNNARNFYPPVNNHCCSNQFNNELVKRLVDKFNSNSNHKINGYVIETIKPGTRIESQTNNYNYENIITQIT